MDFLLRIEQSAFLTWVREGGSLLGYPAILFMHTLGLATVAGVNAALDLRVLGFAPRTPLASLTPLFTLIWAAFAATAVSGTILLLADASTKLASPVFYVKMVFVGLALVNLRLLKTRVFAPSGAAPATASMSRMLALTSLVLWLAATTAGRLMAYIGPSSGIR